jgi:hypothetical protein
MNAAYRSELLAACALAAALLVASDASAQFGSPLRPAPGFKHLARDSIAVSAAREENFIQSETSLSVDVAFGGSS